MKNNNKQNNKNNQIISFIFINYKLILFLLFLLISLIYSYLLYSSSFSSSFILNLINKDILTLKTIFYSNKPHIHYCYNYGSLDYIPNKLVTAYKSINQYNNYQLTILNCSQILPSGKTIEMKYNLNKKWKPMIFITIPWSKPIQITPMSLKESNSIANFILTSVKPKHHYVSNTKEFEDYCQFKTKKGKSINQNDNQNYNGVCFVVMKGNRYTDYHDSLIDSVIKEYYKYNVVLINSNERRLSFEKYLKDNSYLNPNNYGIKIYLVKNTTYYMELTDSPNYENIQKFMKKIQNVSYFRSFFISFFLS